MERPARYELKFIVDEQRAQAIAAHVRMHLRATAYNRWGPVPGQPTISLYFDSPDFLFFRQGMAGNKNRIKLRIRFYDDHPDHPAFLEVKRRLTEVICKDRAMVTRQAANQLLAYGWPNPSYWPRASGLVQGKGGMDSYSFFFRLCSQFRARPVIYVSYLREAYESPTDERMRVTFDRQIHATTVQCGARLMMPERGVPLPAGRPPYHFPANPVVLELKFNQYAPNWMYDLVKAFGLDRRPVSKYCSCMDALGVPEGRKVLPEYERPLMLKLPPAAASRPNSAAAMNRGAVA